jgi:hypothetical protein
MATSFQLSKFSISKNRPATIASPEAAQSRMRVARLLRRSIFLFDSGPHSAKTSQGQQTRRAACVFHQTRQGMSHGTPRDTLPWDT